MTSYEGLRAARIRRRRHRADAGTAPGDFSQTFAQNGQLLRSSTRSRRAPNPAGGFIRDPFAGQHHPGGPDGSGRASVMKYFPLPNQAGDPFTGADNYSRRARRARTSTNFDGRLDHHISDRQKLFVRYSYRRRERSRRSSSRRISPSPRGASTSRTAPQRAWSTYNRTMSNTTVLTARLGFARTLYIFDNQGLGFKPSSLGLPASIDTAVDRPMFPRFGVAATLTLGGNDHRYNAFMSYTQRRSLTNMRGAHTLKAGFDGRMIRVNVWEARSAGTFYFSAARRRGPIPTAASAPRALRSHPSCSAPAAQRLLIQSWKNVASQQLLLGRLFPGRLARQRAADAEPRAPLRHRLAADGTLRPDELLRSGRAVAARATVPGFPNLKGGLVFVGVDGHRRYQYNWDTNNIAPRLGLSFQVTRRP